MTTRVASHVGHDTKPLVPWEKRIFQDWKGWQVAGSGYVKPVIKVGAAPKTSLRELWLQTD